MFASYHNHTVFSDGQDTPEWMVMSAKEQNVDILGISDHYYNDGSEKAPEWALQYENIALYFHELERLAEQVPEVSLKIGLEFDWLDGKGELLRPLADDKRLDFTIGSVHYIGQNSFDSTAKFWENLSIEESDAMIERYWKSVIQMAESKMFMIAGHLDLVKKFNPIYQSDHTKIIREALDAIKEAGMVVELNTSGWIKPCKESYPSESILRACRHREIPVTISSDAHKARFLTSNFSRGITLLKIAGYTKLAQFDKREITFKEFN